MNSSNAWKRFLKRKVSVVAGIVAILIVIIALVGPMFCTQDPYKQNLPNIFSALITLAAIPLLELFMVLVFPWV